MWRVSAQPDIRPGPALVAALVDAVAVGDVDADRRLAGAGVDHIRIGGRDRDRADGRGGEEAVGDVAPIGAGVDGFPDAAGASAEVERVPVGVAPGYRYDAPAAEWADTAPLQEPVEREIRRHASILVQTCELIAGTVTQIGIAWGPVHVATRHQFGERNVQLSAEQEHGIRHQPVFDVVVRAGDLGEGGHRVALGGGQHGFDARVVFGQALG